MPSVLSSGTLVRIIDVLKATDAQNEENIFRTAGNKANTDRIVNAINSGQSLEEFKKPEYCNDVANAMKRWFRESDEPLIPMNLYNTFIDAGSNINSIQNAISQLPPENHKCLHILCEYLLVISANSKVNMMNNRALGVVFAPSLMWERFLDMTKSSIQSTVLMTILDNYEIIFSGAAPEPTPESAPRRAVPSGSPWRKTLDPVSGDFYYYHYVTREVSWDPPEEQNTEWKTVRDKQSGDNYYWNSRTNETTWDKPEELKRKRAPAEIPGFDRPSSPGYDRPSSPGMPRRGYDEASFSSAVTSTPARSYDENNFVSSPAAPALPNRGATIRPRLPNEQPSGRPRISTPAYARDESNSMPSRPAPATPARPAPALPNRGPPVAAAPVQEPEPEEDLGDLLPSGLPWGWEEFTDSFGNVKYKSDHANVVQDNRPTRPALPTGWIACWDEGSGKFYFQNMSQQQTTWDPPSF